MFQIFFPQVLCGCGVGEKIITSSLPDKQTPPELAHSLQERRDPHPSEKSPLQMSSIFKASLPVTCPCHFRTIMGGQFGGALWCSSLASVPDSEAPQSFLMQQLNEPCFVAVETIAYRGAANDGRPRSRRVGAGPRPRPPATPVGVLPPLLGGP